MRRISFFILSVALGAGGFWLYQEYYVSQRDGPVVPEEEWGPVVTGEDSSEGAVLYNPANREAGESGEESLGPEIPTEPPAPDPTVVEGLSHGAQGPASRETSPEEVSKVQVIGQADPPAEDGLSALGGEKKDGESSLLSGASAEKLKEVVDLAEEALNSGDLQRGYGLYREVFLAAEDRQDVDVFPVARKVLDLSTSEEEKVRCSIYLAERDPDPKRVHLAALKAGSALAGKRDAEHVRRAWDLLSRAYLSAQNQGERKKVLSVLEPFLDKHIFSKRFSPLVRRHTVKEGESAWTIATKKEYGTTVDAIMRLNGLRSDVIQTGQRLVILPGKVEIFVKKRDFRLWVLVDGKLLMEKPVGLGERDATPVGTFVISEKSVDPEWWRPGEPPIPPGDPRNILGSRWLGFKDTEDYTGFGIHGTGNESDIGKESSSGCIRLLNADIELLFDFVPRGTRVVVED